MYSSDPFVRVGFIFEWPQETVVFAFLLTWIIVPVSYDLVTIRKIHKATTIGVGFTFLSFIIIIAIVFSPLMEGITEFLYGSN